MLFSSIGRNGLMLAVFATIATGIIAGTYLGTKERVADNKRKVEEAALLQVVSRDSHDNSMLDDTQPLMDQELLGLREAKKSFIARRGKDAVAVIVPAVAREGYSGDIELIVGVDAQGEVTGVRVLAHRETPGLGDGIEYKKSDWVDSFIGRSLKNTADALWGVHKDGGVFDQFTGATITPRAVIKAVKQSLQYVEQERESLFAPLPNQASSSERRNDAAASGGNGE